MDHQQNYEFSDPNAFGFINSFSASDNFMLGQTHQGQQLNGKSQTELPHLASMQGFDPANSVPSQFLTQTEPILFNLPDPEQQTPLFNQPSIDYQQITISTNMSAQKDSMFNLSNPPLAVPVDIIQSPESDLPQADAPSQVIHQLSEISSTEAVQIEESSQEVAGKQSPVVFSPEQNSMMKALGVVRKDVLVPASGAKKRRRRILQLNEDDSDDDTELKKQLLDESLELEKEAEDDKGTEDSSPDSESDDDPSLANDPSALKVRSLLKSAVIIQGPDSKKKKKRVLESDDEDEIQTSVDDIGLIEPNEPENEEEPLNNDIIVSDAGFNSIELNDHILVAEIKSPIMTASELINTDVVAIPVNSEKLEVSPEESVEVSKSDDTSMVVTEDTKTMKQEENKSIIKIEEIDPSLTVEAILDNIKPMADDDEFFKVNDKSDDSDCQFVSNEDYFGTPDNSKPQSTGNRRRRPQTGMGSQSSNRRKRSNKYEKDFVEGSSESEDTSYSEPSESSSDSSDVESNQQKSRLPIRKSPIIVQQKSFSVMRVPIRKKVARKDRFYDKSRDIPNDVYFGDVNVPLHVLHTRWDSDAESSDSSGGNRNSHAKSINVNRFSNFQSSNISSPSFNYIDQSDDPKLSTAKEFAKISGIKINYAKLFNGVRTTDEKYMLIRRILAQKGLQGEPTVAKCKQLRLDLQAKRESAELDKSLIIRSEGRTRRATRNVSSKSPFSSQPSTSSAVVQPETLQTLSKIRRVVDSDSE